MEAQIEAQMEVLIESIVKLGNHPDFKRWVEPNVRSPLKLEKWMVERTLKAISALKEEYDLRQPTQSDNR